MNFTRKQLTGYIADAYDLNWLAPNHNETQQTANHVHN